jgi:carbon storage regulator
MLGGGSRPAADHFGELAVLVLSRSAGESVMIGSDIVVTVLEVRGDVVRIGIDAPRNVRVHREEVYRALEEANRAAAASSGADAEAALTAHLPKRADGQGGRSDG